MSKTKRLLIKHISRRLDCFELNLSGTCLPTEHLKSAQEIVQHVSMHCGLNWNLTVLVFEERENQSSWRKTYQRKERTNHKLNPHMTPGPGIETGPDWWDLSALSTAPPLLPKQI